MFENDLYLPNSREYFWKYIREKKGELYDAMLEYKVGPTSGYGTFYRGHEIIQCMRDIYHNINEMFNQLRIPEDFSSPKALVNAWEWFLQFLKQKDDLFNDVASVLIEKIKNSDYFEEGDNPYTYLPEPLKAIDQIRLEIMDVLEHVLKMDEVKLYITAVGSSQTLSNESAFKDGETKVQSIDLAIITAMKDPEFKRVKELFTDYTIINIQDDPSIYYKGTFKHNGKAISVIAVSDDTMGMVAAATLATKVLYNFKPKYLVMLGIAAGTSKEANIGDIMIGSHLWDYGSGKIDTTTKGKPAFVPYINQVDLDASLELKLKALADENTYLSGIIKSWNKSKKEVSKSITVRIGPFASGSAVVANKDKTLEIKGQHVKIIGFDMEAYSVFHAAKYGPGQSTKVLVIKSVSDLADASKNNPDKDLHQDFAAYTSAQYFYNLALHELTY